MLMSLRGQYFYLAQLYWDPSIQLKSGDPWQWQILTSSCLAYHLHLPSAIGPLLPSDLGEGLLSFTTNGCLTNVLLNDLVKEGYSEASRMMSWGWGFRVHVSYNKSTPPYLSSETFNSLPPHYWGNFCFSCLINTCHHWTQVLSISQGND